ncbi:MAG TPA: hypothetical protein VMB03_25380 [Bryobacteraceae bacterium]|nr:hypothetical protein [Bryobacteraceae bacterium]
MVAIVMGRKRAYSQTAMWKPALFLITIVLVTPAGHEAAEEYWSRMSTTFAGSPYGELALIALALVAVLVVLLMCCQTSKDLEARWEWHQVRTDPNGDPAHRTQ